MMGRNYDTLIGVQFNRLTVLEIIYAKRTTARCKCICNKEIVVRVDCLESGNNQSCGCLKNDVAGKIKTHGLTSHPLYRIYYSIKERCYNKNRRNYYLYGGRGVQICEEWLNSPERFINWALLNKWEKGKQIDKDIIPNKLGVPAILYSPEMCSVVDPLINNNNKRNTPFITYENRTLSLMEWARITDIPPETIRNRLKRNWPPDKILEKCRYNHRGNKRV